MGRRIKKTVSVSNDNALDNESDKFFVYDGWNLIAVMDSEGEIERAFG